MHGKINNQVTLSENGFEKRFISPDKDINYEREFAFYQWCMEKKLTQVPRLLNFKQEEKKLVLEYVDGKSHQVINNNTLVQIGDFLRDLNQFGDPSELPLAGESICSIKDLSNHIQRRWQDIGNKGKYDTNGLSDKVLEILFTLNEHYFDIGKLIANPSDLGLHNIIEKGQQLIFIDFEYAGYDSQLKCLMDFCLHPANNLPLNSIQPINQIFAKALKTNPLVIPEFVIRAFCLWWILRILKSISEEVIENRVVTGVLSPRQKKAYIEQRHEQYKYFWDIVRFN